MVRLRRDPLNDLLGEVSRIQDEFARCFAAPAAGPAVTVWADDNNFYVAADLPGFDPAKIDVTVTDGSKVTLGAERAAALPEGATWLRQERPSGKFSRTLALPVLVDADKAATQYENGVLTVTLPKSEAAKPRKIAVA
jgi:HSP20 family protein